MRVRLGIGKPADKSSIENYVLEPFPSDELPLLPEIIEMAAGAVCEIILSGIQKAMGKYHKINTSNSLMKEVE
jgi:PTH1 family peptidyl-tRNA hydrolase